MTELQSPLFGQWTAATMMRACVVYCSTEAMPHNMNMPSPALDGQVCANDKKA